MPFHFCGDELYAILLMLPVIGGAISWLRAKLGAKKKLT